MKSGRRRRRHRFMPGRPAPVRTHERLDFVAFVATSSSPWSCSAVVFVVSSSGRIEYPTASSPAQRSPVGDGVVSRAATDPVGHHAGLRDRPDLTHLSRSDLAHVSSGRGILAGEGQRSFRSACTTSSGGAGETAVYGPSSAVGAGERVAQVHAWLAAVRAGAAALRRQPAPTPTSISACSRRGTRGSRPSIACGSPSNSRICFAVARIDLVVLSEANAPLAAEVVRGELLLCAEPGRGGREPALLPGDAPAGPRAVLWRAIPRPSRDGAVTPGKVRAVAVRAEGGASPGHAGAALPDEHAAIHDVSAALPLEAQALAKCRLPPHPDPFEQRDRRLVAGSTEATTRCLPITRNRWSRSARTASVPRPVRWNAGAMVKPISTCSSSTKCTPRSPTSVCEHGSRTASWSTSPGRPRPPARTDAMKRAASSASAGAKLWERHTSGSAAVGAERARVPRAEAVEDEPLGRELRRLHRVRLRRGRP